MVYNLQIQQAEMIQEKEPPSSWNCGDVIIIYKDLRQDWHEIHLIIEGQNWMKIEKGSQWTVK